MVGRALRATFAGFRQTQIQGDPLQQGGVLVFDRALHEVYRYVSAAAGDHPPIAAIVAAVRRAR